MKIKPSTLGLVFVALLLGGIALIVMQQPAPESSESGVVSEAQPLFEFDAAAIQAFSLKTRLRTLKFERDRNDKWQMLEPEQVAASDPSIAFLLDLVTTDKSKSTVIVPAKDREQFGLHQPMATIDLTLKDQTTHQLIIGDYNFDRGNLYAQVDPADQGTQLKLFLVSSGFDNAVNRPLNEWKQPAGAEKSTNPSSSPKASDSPTPSASPSAQSEPQQNSQTKNSQTETQSSPEETTDSQSPAEP